MRWQANPKPKSGDRKIVSRFLFLPKRIGNDVRWLEFAKWVLKYVTVQENSQLDKDQWLPLTWQDTD